MYGNSIICECYLQVVEVGLKVSEVRQNLSAKGGEAASL